MRKRAEPDFWNSVWAAAGCLGLLVAQAVAAPGDLLHVLRKETGNFFDHFAYSIAILGDDDVLVGAPFDDTSGNDTGAAYLYDLATGDLVQTFLNPTPERGDYYSKSVGSVGAMALIGSSGEEPGRVFLRDVPTTDVIRFFEGSSDGDYYGHSISSEGTQVLVGAFKEDVGASNSGTAYLIDSNNGDRLHTWDNPTPEPEDYFAERVAISQGRAIIAAKGDNTGALRAGVTYVYDTDTGDLLHTLHNPDPQRDDEFGTTLAPFGNDYLIGVPFKDAGARNSGIVYWFDGDTGQLAGEFENPSPAVEAQFGAAIVAVGDHVLIGAPVADEQTQQGAVYVFDAMTHELVHTYHAPLEAMRAGFGKTLAATPEFVAVGAPYDDGLAANAGAVYVFAAIPEPSPGGMLLLIGACGLLLRCWRRSHCREPLSSG